MALPSPASAPERRKQRRGRLYHGRRRYPRLPLDVDWFLQSEELSTYGRGLEVSLRGVRLAVTVAVRLAGPLTLHLALPGRTRLFKARVTPVSFSQTRGTVLRFEGLADEELALLAQALIERHGYGAVPSLDRRFRRFTLLDRRFLAVST